MPLTVAADWRALLAAVIAAMSLLADRACAQDEAPADASLASVTTAYEEAFNKHDAAAIGRLWRESGVHIDRSTGQRTAGRAAIERDLAEAFKLQPQQRLVLEMSDVRMIQPTVARAEGVATVLIPDALPDVLAVTVLLVKEGDAWLIDSVEESPAPQPAGPRDALEELAWLIGDWADESDDAVAGSSFQWSTSGTFLVRRFQTQRGDEEVSQGTQIIGWDPRAQHIRSWTFYSDGSFGEATWSKNGSDWLIKSAQTLADGGAASGTYVLTREGDEAMTVGLIGHEVNGEPVPAVPPVRVVRLAADVVGEAEGDGQ
ncbi:MAG: SgcJ/EcaC family oxidoreductase [Planctomyces sp.]|nr:SgcJ/EcaC family oxidoreductase [Planctomyces sp.]